MPDYIALAIPFFFAFIGVELWVARRRGLRIYRFADVLSDLSAGISQQVAFLFWKAALIGAYAAVFEWARARHLVLPLPASSVWTWGVAIVLVDFTYYWWHRLSHEVNFLWAVHVVHHSSEDYNLAVALRQAMLSGFTIFPFHLPLALCGIPPVVLATVEAFNVLYQFWIHTQLIGKLGPVEAVMNTPSHHRVHHAINPRYLDRNYGGTFIVFDRLFGTCAVEAEAPVYGIVQPLDSMNPWWAQVHYFVELWRRMRAAPRLRDGLGVWWHGPPWSPPGVPQKAPPPEVTPASFVKHDPKLPKPLARYLFASLAVLLPGVTAFLFLGAGLPFAARLGVAALILVTLAAWGGLIERRRWARPLELLRFALLGGALALATSALAQGTTLGAGSLAVIALLGLAAFLAWFVRVGPRPSPG